MSLPKTSTVRPRTQGWYEVPESDNYDQGSRCTFLDLRPLISDLNLALRWWLTRHVRVRSLEWGDSELKE